MSVGLLLPIGQDHLESAEASGLTSVVFGTNAWELMREFVTSPGVGAPVLFYESWGPALPQVSWRATFADYVESSSGYPPASWSRYREPIAAEEDAESAHGPGYFSGYYRVEDFQRLEEPKPFSALRTYPRSKPLARGFRPHGPVIIEW